MGGCGRAHGLGQLVPKWSHFFCSASQCSYAASEESRILALTELLEQKAHSPFYQEGVSNALLKMAELGLARAAAVLLQSGANLNFEGQQQPSRAKARQPGQVSAISPFSHRGDLPFFFVGWLSGGS